MSSAPLLKTHPEIAEVMLRELNGIFGGSLILETSSDGFGIDAQTGREWLEMAVSAAEPANAPLKALLPGQKTVRDGQQFLFAEVFLFCVCPGVNYQERAHEDLERQKLHWRSELNAVRLQLDREDLVSVPFGRFLCADEDPTAWVPEIIKIAIDPRRFIQRGGVSADTVNISVLRRPFILWPTYRTRGSFEDPKTRAPYVPDIPKTRVHVTHTSGGPAHIARPTPAAIRSMSF